MRWIVCLLVLLSAVHVSAETCTVGVAISLKETMIDLGAEYQRLTGDEVEFAFAASGQLLTQIKNGAPIDAFISAAPQQIEELDKAKLAVMNTRRVIAWNRLVLIAPTRPESSMKRLEDLVDAKKLAMGQPKVVPAGQYAAQALQRLKIDPPAERIVHGQNVRQVLDYVSRGEVDAGLVYATDAAQALGRVKVIAAVPADLHDPIEYAGVVVSASKKQETAGRFINFLASRQARAILTRHGFAVEQPATRPTTKPAPSSARH